MSDCGGDFSGRTLPPCVSLLTPVAEETGESHGLMQRALNEGGGWTPDPGWRVVHVPALDVGMDDSLRVAQIVTSLQTGGAERIAVDLANVLPSLGLATRIMTTGSPLRSSYPAPAGWLDFSGREPAARRQAIRQAAVRLGLDVLHGHLLDAEEARGLSASGIPLVLTIHNTRVAWPEGMTTLGMADCALLVACARAVERELRSAGIATAIRTVWNGVQAAEIREETAQSPARASRQDQEVVLACVANPRPQKRLEKLPAILAAVKARLAGRGDSVEVRLVIAGETSARSASALACRKQVDEETRRWHLGPYITWTEGKIPVTDVLAGARVLISCSAHEGLSLAHLEALAAGIPVVATDAGGTREIASRNPGLHLLPLEATPADFAARIVEVLGSSTPAPPLSEDFTTTTRALRYAAHYRRVACRASSPRKIGRGIWFITNNLSTGGAQSSLRRLVAELHESGFPVRVVVLQEEPDLPTPGRMDLVGRNVPVLALPPTDFHDGSGPWSGVDFLLDKIDSDAPQAVVFWNVMPEWKVRLVEGLWSTPVFDVSPGEMLYASLERLFRRPPPGLPMRNAQEYGERLTAVAVKYAAESRVCRSVLGKTPVVIPNGIPERPVVAPAPRPGSAVIFGTAARLSPQKRLEDLIEAFRLVAPRLPGCELRIAGEVEPDGDTYANRLRESAQGLPVIWLGEVSDMPGFHSELDVFVMISEPAGCPNASLEAMMSGLPVIATDYGGAGEQVLHGVNGLLVPPRDARALSNAMAQLGLDPSQGSAMGRAGATHVREHFSMRRMAARYREWLGI
jgi:glycosyltransferase involved in cell wall biosynthesis